MNIRLLAQRLRDAAATVDRREEVIWLFINHISLFSCFFLFSDSRRTKKNNGYHGSMKKKILFINVFFSFN